MRRLRTVPLIVSLMLLARWSVGQGDTAPAAREKLLSLSVKQLGEQHCQSYPDAFSVALRLGSRLRNESSEKIIVARNLGSPFHASVSTSSEELKQGHFVYDPSVLEVSNQNPSPSEKFEERPDFARFVILDPGDEFETETWAHVIADLTTSQRPSANYGPTAGQYFMQVQLRTWPYAATEESEMRRIEETWRPWGILFTAAIKSRPFPITLPEIKRGISCEPAKRSGSKANHIPNR